MENTISLIMVFCAGIFSFLSPCLLPIIPSYLSFIGGIGFSKDSERKANRSVIIAAFFFVLGFSSVFIALSVILARVMFFFKGTINIIAGIIIILMGLHSIFNIFSFLEHEKRFHVAKRPANFIGCYLVGMAFGAGWTPCIGPLLSSILIIAGYDGEIPKAIGYLAVYSLGLGLPFMGAAVFLQAFLAKLAKLKKTALLIPKISGCILVLLGVFMLFGRFQWFNTLLQQQSNRFVLWATSGGKAVQIIPALFFIVIALIPCGICFLKKKKVSPPAAVVSGISLICAVLQLAGILDAAGLLADWIVYQQSI
jgi:cytochrome c-type biogenesis protein